MRRRLVRMFHNKNETLTVMASPVKILGFTNYDFYAIQITNEFIAAFNLNPRQWVKGWRVFEATTGMRVNHGFSTIGIAVRDAKKVLDLKTIEKPLLTYLDKAGYDLQQKGLSYPLNKVK